jgi:hypothetical protein
MTLPSGMRLCKIRNSNVVASLIMVLGFLNDVRLLIKLIFIDQIHEDDELITRDLKSVGVDI